MKRHFSGSDTTKTEGEMSIRYLIWLHKVKAKNALGFRDFRGFVINDEIIEELLITLQKKTRGNNLASHFY
jgi:hypothetical protein